MREPHTLTDWDLFQQGAHDHEAFAALFARHKDFVYRLARGYLGCADLAEDVTQEVFIRIFQKRARWTPRARFRTWLYRVALNTARELRRKQKREAGHRERMGAELVVAPQDAEANESRLKEMERVLEVLSERQRAVLLLRFFEGLSVQDTARVLGCRAGTVKSHLHRALATLRVRLQSEASAGNA
ncbi:MAG: RNA polymerase sigma factor [Kiritimatiellae bacterium]|nr:RNA polymerase sigma factor [Kiritimatiellia bacterium]